MSSGYHTTWKIPAEHQESPGYLAAGRRLAFAEAVYVRRSALGWSLEDLAVRSGLTPELLESIEESGVDPTLDLVERLASALDSMAQIDPGHSPAIRFQGHAA